MVVPLIARSNSARFRNGIPQECNMTAPRLRISRNIALMWVVLLAACWGSTMVWADEYLSAKELQAAYRKNCPVNVSALKEFLVKKKTRLKGTNRLIVNEYQLRVLPYEKRSLILRCDFQIDPVYASMGDPANIAKTESAIRQLGKQKYIEATIDSLSSTKKKYQIDRLTALADSDTGMSFEELEVLIAFAKTRARSDAVVSVLRASPN